MKEQVSIMRSACAVLTCWRRWERSRSVAARFLSRRRSSGVEGLSVGCSWGVSLDRGWSSGVVMFAWDRG